LEKEEDTRRYRHDENGHLVCLQHLLECQKYAEAKEYLATMQGQVRTMQNKSYQVGNEVFDAVLKKNVLLIIMITIIF
jgi:hypothetical protein